MPTYRVYYVEREPKRPISDPYIRDLLPQREHLKEMEWEEEIEAPTPEAALDAFFQDHVRDSSQVMWLDEAGEGQPLTGVRYDPERTYVWLEEDEDGVVRLMEYEGIEEATPGMVTCPLCGGSGEVDEEIADEFDEVWGEEEDGEIGADIQG